MDIHEKSQLLITSNFFGDMEIEKISKIAEMGKPIEKKFGEIVSLAGNDNLGIYFIQHGVIGGFIGNSQTPCTKFSDFKILASSSVLGNYKNNLTYKVLSSKAVLLFIPKIALSSFQKENGWDLFNIQKGVLSILCEEMEQIQNFHQNLNQAYTKEQELKFSTEHLIENLKLIYRDFNQDGKIRHSINRGIIDALIEIKLQNPDLEKLLESIISDVNNLVKSEKSASDTLQKCFDIFSKFIQEQKTKNGK